MKDICIGSMAFGSKRYVNSVQKMKQSLIEQGYTGDFDSRHKIPLSYPQHPSPNHISSPGTVPYGFKYYLLDELSKNYRYVGYLDSLVLLQKPFSELLCSIKENGYYFGYNCPAAPWISDECLQFFNMDRKDIENLSMIHGGIVFLDTHNKVSSNYLKKMKELAIVGGPFCGDWVTQSKNYKGHRHDQSVASILLREYGMTKLDNTCLTYGADKKFTFKMNNE